MKALVQRVSKASVNINNKCVSNIQEGVCVFLGIREDDSSEDVMYLVNKITKLRIFNDDRGKMNLSLNDINGSAIIISQFTLYGNCKKGNRPSFSKTASQLIARPLYELFINLLKEKNINVKTGKFGKNMDVNIVNQGPVTFMLESTL